MDEHVDVFAGIPSGNMQDDLYVIDKRFGFVPSAHHAPRFRERRSPERLRREQSARLKEREQALTQARQSVRAAGLRAGLSSADADDLASHFVLSYLRRVAPTEASVSADTVAAPQRYLPLFLRCEIARVRVRVRRESAVPDIEATYNDTPHGAAPVQIQQQGQQRALWDAVGDALSKLSYLQREVLIAFALNDEPLATIAVRHDITEAAAKQVLYRARRSLRTLLQSWQED